MAPSQSNSALILEEPLIRTPYELLRRSHRSAQRQVEKEFIAVQAALNTLLKAANSDPEAARRNAMARLDQAGDRVTGLKRKLDNLQPRASNPTVLRARLSYLEDMSTPPGDAPKGGVSSGSEDKGDCNVERYLVDYLLRTGRLETAKALAEKAGIENLVDMKLFAELVKIETALIDKHSVTEALAWCGENRGSLKKNKNDLEFTLRLQDFIELCRKRDTLGAIAYSRKFLVGWASTHMAEVQRAMTLLAFGPTTGVGAYRDLYNELRWSIVRDKFRQTFLALYSQPGQPLLSLALSAGLSTLRLPSCVSYEGSSQTPQIPRLPAAPPLHTLEDPLALAVATDPAFAPPDLPIEPDATVGNVDCPTCGQHLHVLAAECPMSHHVNSSLVCRISGAVMDSTNPPMCFPNGYVYSQNALLEMARTNFDVVTCPRTKESCVYARLGKVYIS